MRRIPMIFNFLLIALLFTNCTDKLGSGDQVRQKIKFDYDWRFSKGDFEGASAINFDDSDWELLDVPHDWAILDTFSKDYPTRGSGGYASGGVGWYRKTFTLDKGLKDSKVAIEFGGVYENSEVWINGEFLGKRPFGYISFGYDITPHLNFNGENIIAVRVDNSKQPSARWYTGCGIYRHVWLVTTEKLHIGRYGVYATTPEVNEDEAIVKVRTLLENEFTDAKNVDLINEIYSADNKLVASVSSTSDLSGESSDEISQQLSVSSPELWSPDSPTLYKLKTIIKANGKVYDEYITNIGIRSFSFSADTGFVLNGKSMKILGVNNHSDLGSLGAAINDRVLERRLEILKEMGCNAIRTAHNPPCKELLDMCDKMGFMVMDEAFDEWLESWPFGGEKKPEGKAKYGYHLHFNEWAETDLTELIRRDRNHPSVILWSVGNEIPDACFERGTERLKTLMKVAKREDPTRPVTSGITHMHLANESGYASQLDVTGYNGGGGSVFMYQNDKETYPERKFIASEVPHTFQTRGIYRTKTSFSRGKNLLGGVMDIPDLTEEEVFTGISRHYSSSYDNATIRISARDSWRLTRDLPYMSGEFRWTGFDYRGEAISGWPARFWNFGIIDICGFPKDHYYFYQSQWTEKPMVHILPHWTWEGKEGVEIPVVAYSNCESVELFINNVSLGEQQMNDLDLVWKVPYEKGVLMAVGKNNGREVCRKEIITAEEPSQVQLLADRMTIFADRQNVVHIEINLLDAKGHFVPTALNRMNFTVEGEATIMAVDNGDPLNDDPYRGNTVKVFNGKCLVILKSTGNPGSIKLTVESDGIEGAEIVVNAVEEV